MKKFFSLVLITGLVFPIISQQVAFARVQLEVESPAVLDDVAIGGGKDSGRDSVGKLEINELPFEDVSQADWYYKDVLWAYKNGVTSGVEESKFAPTNEVTRAQFAQFIYNMEKPKKEEAEFAFSDVPEDEWYFDAVMWCVNNGIVNGGNDNKFNPNDSLSRQEMAVMISRYITYKDLKLVVTSEYRVFPDENEIADYAKSSVQLLNKLGIITGVDDYKIAPLATSNRAQVVAVLQRLSSLIKE